MAERVTDDQHPQRLLAPNNLGGESNRVDSPGGDVVRIDSLHNPLLEIAPREVERQQRQHFAPARLTEPAAISNSSDSTSAETTLLADTTLLDEFTQHFRRRDAQIQAQKSILAQREQALIAQHAALEDEHKQNTHQLTIEDAHLEAKTNQLETNKAAFAERQIEFEIQLRKFDSDYQTFQQQRAELEQRKNSFREVLIAELAAEHSQLEQAKAAFQKDLDQVQALKEDLHRRLESLADENAQTLKTEREKLWQSLTEEWEQRRLEFQGVQDEWTGTRDLERSEIDREKAMFESAVESANNEFLQSRESLTAELTDMRRRQNECLEAERQEWAEKRRQCEAEFNEIRGRHVAEMTAQRTEWQETLRGERSQLESEKVELDDLKAVRELEFIGLREQHSAKLRAEEEQWRRTCTRETALLEERRAELMRERTLIENRIRFQQEHLDKSRIEFEQAQNDDRRERQVERQKLVDANLLMIRRLRQIDLYRSSIDAREKSLDREHEVFSRTRQALSSTADLDRLNLQAEKHAWEEERQIQQQELRKQQEALAIRSEGLESRRARLDKLRAELEETHRATLEMRLAVEEAWAQFSQMAGQDDARQRVELVRQSLMGYYQQMHESMAEQRREYVEGQAKFERQRAEFADERQKLTTWLTSRDEELRLGQERLRIAAGDAAQNHTKWLAARDQWLVEKAEAEFLIRRLLTSLGDNNRDQSVDPEFMLGLDEINGPRDDAFAKLRGEGAD